MTTHEIHALSGAYAVDALDDIERARFEEHLDVCAECRAEVATLQEATGLLAEVSPVAPSPALRGRLLEEIKTVRPLPPETAPTVLRPRRPIWLSTGRGLAVAAALLAVVGVGTVVAVDQIRDGAPSQTLTASERILAAADAQSVRVDLPGPGSARVVRSVSEGRAVLITDNMPAAPEGRVYEIWLQHGDRMVPAGLMEGAGSQQVLLEGDAANASAAGITVEPAGGSPEPTSAPVALFDFEQAT